MRNLLAHAPKSHEEMIAATVRTIFAQPEPEATRVQLWEVVGKPAHLAPRTEPSAESSPARDLPRLQLP